MLHFRVDALAAKDVADGDAVAALTFATEHEAAGGAAAAAEAAGAAKIVSRAFPLVRHCESPHTHHHSSSNRQKVQTDLQYRQISPQLYCMTMNVVMGAERCGGSLSLCRELEP